jgi:hypothetical protein
VALSIEDVPEIPTEGAGLVEAGDARWVPVSCSDHDGFVGACVGCRETWKATREAMLRVALTNHGAGL